MGQHLHLLAKPDIRPLRDAHEWFLDGLRLICRFPVLWVAYSGISFGLLFLTAMIVLFIPFGSVIFSCLFVVLQSGAYRLMDSISGGEKPRLREMFWLLGQRANGAFWQYLLFLMVLSMTLMMLQRLIDAQSFFLNDGYRPVNPQLLIGAIGFNLAVTLVILASSWAILPILSHFPEKDFSQAFRLQISGTLRNWRSLGYFLLILSVVLFLVSFLITVCFSFSPLLALTLIAICLLWLWPITFAWGFSAARHIFMAW